MKEEAFNLPSDSYFLPDNNSPDDILEENNFLSSEVKPENIFRHSVKDVSETQLSSLILEFPFTLDSYQLLYLKNKEDPELGGLDCKIFLGNLEKIKFDEPILKLIFFSKDRKSPLNLKDYPNEMNSLITNLGIEYMSVFQNKLFIQCENENMTNEAYTSLQQSSTVFDLLYDEERSINSLDEQNKGINFGVNSDKKNNNNENFSCEGILSSNKKEKNEELFNKFDFPNLNTKKMNEKDFSYNEDKKNDIFSNINIDQKNIWNSKQVQINKNSNINDNKKQNIPLQNQNNQNNTTNKEESNIKQKPSQNKNPQVIFPPKIFPPLILPINNLPKIPPNPSLMMQIPKINPFLLQTALLMQNLIKLQQLNLKNENKNKKNTPINNINNFNGKNENFKNNNNNIEPDNYLSSNNNTKESSTNSNTSSTSSKESSPSANNQYNNNNFNIPNNNFPLFNGFNLKAPNNFIPNNNTINNNINKDLINNLKIDDKNNTNNTTNKDEHEINNSNLEEIVLNKKYKEYIPKNKKNNEKEKEKDVKFHTNSTRDYQFKYVSRYIVQIENEKNFPVTKMIIGNNGKLLRQILLENCINLGDHTTKIRLRGKGSGYKEGPKNEESKDPMELCISSLNMLSYMRCSQAIENLLLNVYYQYYLYQCNNASSEKNNTVNNDNINNKKEIKDKNGCPIIMKKILKYQYVVNRYNTLVKEEKRRKKEEELKNSNQNISYNDNKNCNHS